MIDAVGMEAHGAPLAETVQKAAGMLPKRAAAKMVENLAVDRMEVLLAPRTAGRAGLRRAVYAPSATGAPPAGAGFSLCSPGIFDDLAALGLSISEEQGEVLL